MVVGSSDGSLFIYAIKNLPPSTGERELEDIIKQCLISQLENVKDDEEDSKEMLEKHQLELMQALKKPDDTESEQKDKLDAFEAKLDKIKSANEAILHGKKKIKKKTKNDPNSKSSDSSSDEDEKK